MKKNERILQTIERSKKDTLGVCGRTRSEQWRFLEPSSSSNKESERFMDVEAKCGEALGMGNMLDMIISSLFSSSLLLRDDECEGDGFALVSIFMTRKSREQKSEVSIYQW